MIKKLNKPFLQLAREAIEKALQPFAQANGLKISLGNATFTPTNATFKLNIATTSPTGEVNTKEAEDFKAYAPCFGLKPEHLNSIVTHGGKKFKIVGILPRSRRFPLVGERQPDGKRFKLPIESAYQLHRRESE